MKGKHTNGIAVALTVAGSDSGGGAGIQADLKTFHRLGVFGASAITCVTAQNPRLVSAVQPLSPRLIAEQMDRVFEAFPVGATKTGMLYDATTIEAVARKLKRWKSRNLVVDPVMVASSGATLLKKDAVRALTAKIFPLATVVTPNIIEAEILAQDSIRTLDDQCAVAALLVWKYKVPFLVKGGHLRDGKESVDVFFDGKQLHEYRAKRVRNVKTHGTGCTFSAAIAANLALGYDLPEAIARAKRLVTDAIRGAVKIGKFTTLDV